jgi:hypothetical protein
MKLDIKILIARHIKFRPHLELENDYCHKAKPLL